MSRGRTLKRTKHVYRKFVKRRPKQLSLKPEVKYVTTHVNEQAVNTLSQFSSSAYQLLNGIAIGNTVSTRIGNRVVGKNLVVRGVMRNNSTGSTWLRMVFFEPLDNDSLVQITTGTSMFAGDTPVTINGLDTMYYPLDRQIFRVHSDKVYRFGASTSTTGEDTRFFRKVIKINKKIGFDYTATIPQTNAMYVMYWTAEANDDTSTGVAVELSFLAKYSYVDP